MKSPRWSIKSQAVGIFFLSMGLLAYEVAVTRVFSVIFAYHYVFIVVSITLLGLSIGGMCAYYLNRYLRGRGKSGPPLGAWAGLASLATTLSLFLAVVTGQHSPLIALSATALLPFLFGGVVLASVFERYAERSSALYAADMIGGGIGAVGVVWALDRLGAPASVLTASVFLALSGVIFSFGQKRSPKDRVVAGVVVVAALAAALAAGRQTPRIPIGRDPDKDLFRILADPVRGPEIVESRWSSFGRTDLVRYPDDPHSMALFIDGAAGTSMFHWSGSVLDKTPALEMLKYNFPGSVPLALLEEHQKDSALIIGAGGGRDVLVNLLFGVRDITAVEVNPDLVDLVREYSSYNGGIYNQIDNVHVYADEGRSFLASMDTKYDIIMLTVPVTKGSRSLKGFALTESFLFTEESIRDYLTHLTPEGMLVVVSHGFAESLRLMTTTMAAFEKTGQPAREAMRRSYILGGGMMSVFVAQSAPVDTTKAKKLHAVLHQAGFQGEESYIPHIEQVTVELPLYENVEGEWRMMNQILLDLADGNTSVEQLREASVLDIGPVSDDRPFFYKFERGLPGELTGLLAVSALVLLGVLILPAAGRRRDHLLSGPNQEPAIPWVLPFLFLGLGIGFILVEMALFQKMMLYLGRPALTLGVLLSSLLVGTGLGSLATSRIRSARLIPAIWISTAWVGVMILLLVISLDTLLTPIRSDRTSVTVVASGLLVAAGFFLGLPFPLALRTMKASHAETGIPWMWGINGAASVFGSVLAIAIAVSLGYTTALMLGGIVYLSMSGLVWGGRKGFENRLMKSSGR